MRPKVNVKEPTFTARAEVLPHPDLVALFDVIEDGFCSVLEPFPRICFGGDAFYWAEFAVLRKGETLVKISQNGEQYLKDKVTTANLLTPNVMRESLQSQQKRAILLIIKHKPELLKLQSEFSFGLIRLVLFVHG